MQKSLAIDLFGGDVHAAAAKLGITYQAVQKWPDPLPRAVVDRLIGHYVRQRRRIPAVLLQSVISKKAELSEAKAGVA